FSGTSVGGAEWATRASNIARSRSAVRDPRSPQFVASGFSRKITGTGGPVVAEEPQPVETVHEIRVHGNAAVTDADVIKLAGIAVVDALGPDAVRGIEKRLKDSD